VRSLSKLSKDLIPEGLEVYLEESHRNDIIYRTKNDETKSKLQKLLEDAKTLYDTAVKAGNEEVTDTEEFMLLKRMLGEQTDHDDDDFDDLDPDNIEAKDGKELGSDILQNPSDPDATFRQKYEANIGYTANVVEFLMVIIL